MSSRIRVAFIAITVIFALFVLALGVDSLRFGQGYRIGGERAEPEAPETFDLDVAEAVAGYHIIVRVLVLLAAALIVVSLFVRSLRRQLLRSAILIGVALLALSFFRPTLPEREEETEQEAGGSPGAPGAPGGPVVDPHDVISNEVSPLVTYLVSVVVVALVPLVIITMLRIRRRRRHVDDVRGLLADQAEQTLESLGSSRPHTYPDAITECYAQMQRIVRESRGVSRRAAMTAREFISIVVSAGVPGDAVLTLTELYEEVKYGDQLGDSNRVERAKNALRTIAASCRTPEDVAS